jgi:hypothetical protein
LEKYHINTKEEIPSDSNYHQTYLQCTSQIETIYSGSKNRNTTSHEVFGCRQVCVKSQSSS